VALGFGLSMPTFVGTSGWSYKEWRGSFYPARFPAHGMLSYYAERFRAVEVNNSFYRIPSERVLAGWAEQVPAQFRFVMKASRRITHNHRLRDDDGSLAYFLRAVNPLGKRLGPTLFQLRQPSHGIFPDSATSWHGYRNAGRLRWSFAIHRGLWMRSMSCSAPAMSRWSRWMRTGKTGMGRLSCRLPRGDI
jgi:hypothetical protein